MRHTARENQRMSMRDLEALSSIDPITTTSTGDSECECECEVETSHPIKSVETQD